MTFASDQQGAGVGLSEAAQRMLDLRDAVFATWEARVRERIVQARDVQHPILIDTLPVFYDNIAQSISPDYPRLTAVDGTSVAAEHGGERARVTVYDHAALIEEYQILRWAIFEVLQREQVDIGQHEARTIHASIDAGIQEAVEAFSLVHSGFRERFAAALTHDMRGPLTASMSALELILLSNDLTRVKTVAAKALTNLQRMAAMVDELLNTMAFHSGESIQLALAKVDIWEVAKEVQTDALAAHGPRIHLDGRSIGGCWDRAALKRAVENLVSNAVKYGAAGSPVTIRLGNVHERLLLTVHNEGEPIPPDELECIFQMYRRAEAALRGQRQGWGIGLPYVRAVAESHGGSIGLDSSAERGTTFVIDIPMDARLVRSAPTLQTTDV
ncbi:HAMP domain-containing sensor histidine kinase [Massilia sp. CFBP9026]|uniref:sensor histidine kinase n=1 Tax=Massilia sp. CFBP9026 TaxID=3096536 RepID=UPI002A6A25D8|nr:HAMP domain-containing sensor histidine kinase [Massilia sp. CFBP9026]MDY0960646.1 HAMP domain-containing sensor histidine kinase [Massilia sp. CFBP9026]